MCTGLDKPQPTSLEQAQTQLDLFFILFISVCFHVICVLKPFLGETSLASCWEGGVMARWGGQHCEDCSGRGKDKGEQQKLIT